MANKALPSPELLRKLLSYDAKTGALTWLFREPGSIIGDSSPRWNSIWAGVRAFTADNGQGYRYGKLFGRHYRAHRIIWAVAYGEWPNGHIDHINGDRSDNRLDNLRVVTPSENQRNQKRASNNTSGVTGVFWLKAAQKWSAQITVGGRNKHIGLFNAFEDAVSARKSAEVEFGFHANHGR
jgi:HNH endonuclease